MPRIIRPTTFFLSSIAFLSQASFVHAVGETTEIVCNGNTNTINTALGCISVDNGGQDFVSNVLTLSLGIGGGIALLLILYGFYVLTTSAGMPDKIKAAQQTITAAISGLLFIIMSVVLLNLLGVQILNIPGF